MKKYTIKRQLFICLIILSTTGFYSCNSSKILSATFESDAIDLSPATNIDGAPTGDMIVYNAALAPQLKVVNSATVGKKALNFNNVPVTIESSHNRWVSFKGISTTLGNTLWFSYTAKNLHPAGDILVDISDGAAGLIARMRIQASGDVWLARNIADNYTDFVGRIGQDQHTIIFTASPSTLRYNISIFQIGHAGVIAATDKPMITEAASSFANPAHPSISFQHTLTSGGGGHEYIIEVVTISKKQP